MITMDGIEYDDNLNLETIDFVKSTASSHIVQKKTSFSDNNGNNYYIYKEELYTYDSSGHVYKYDGFNFNVVYTNSSHPVFSKTIGYYIPVVYEDYIYFVGTYKRTTGSSSYISIYKMNALTFETSLFMSLPANDSSYFYVFDAIIYNDYLYIITDGTTSPIERCIRRISLSNLSISLVYDYSNDFLTNLLLCSKFIIYKEKLYVIKERSSISSSNSYTDKIQMAQMYEIKNNSLQLVSTLPIVIGSSGIYLATFFTDENYIYLCPYKISYNLTCYIWRYDGELWSPYISYPIIKNTAYSEQKYYYCNEYNYMLYNCSLDIDASYETFIYNDSIHAINSTNHYIYNKDLHEWLEAGYWICKIKDDISQVTT